MESLQTAKTLLAEACQREPEEIPDNAALDNWDAWNSLAHMRLILAMESHLNRELAPELVVELSSLDDIAAYLDTD